MRKRRIVSLLLCILLLAGCNKQTSQELTKETDKPSKAEATGEKPEGTETETEQPEDPFDDKLPETSFDGANFTILHYDESKTRYFFDVEEDSAEAIASAAFNRNVEIEDRFNVSIGEATAPGNNTLGTLRASNMAGDGVYDVVIPHFIEDKTGMMIDGQISNLRSLPYVDLTRDWWYSYMVDAITVNNQTYYATSDLTVTCQNFFVLLFNKNYMADLQLTEPYEDVFNYTWTMDKLKAMMEAATVSVVGDAASSENKYGLVTCGNLQYQMQLPLELQLIKVQNDEVVIANDQHVADVVESVYDLLYSGNTYLGDYTNQNYITQFFGGGRALFAYFGMGTYYQVIRDIDGFDYGILPFPMMNEAQGKYVVQRSDSLLCVPTVLSNPDKTGMILEALTCASMKLVRPAFYDTVLSTKCLRDETSRKVLDLIFHSFSFETGFIFDSSRSFASILDNLMNSKSKDSQSFIASRKTSVQAGLKKVNEFLGSNSDPGTPQGTKPPSSEAPADNPADTSPAVAARSAFEDIMVTQDQEFYDDPDTLYEGGSGQPIQYVSGYGVGYSSLNDQVIFRDIDFGENGAGKMVIHFSNGGEDNTTLAVYIDEKSGDPDAVYTIPNTGGWEATFAKDFEMPIDVKGGVHDVIVEFTNSNSGSFTFIRFSNASARAASRGEFKFDIAGTSVPTTLDGVIAEGEYAGNAPIVVDGTNYYSDGSWVGSFNGEKYSFYFTWDAENLYVGVTVEGDTTPSQNGPEGDDWFRAGDMVQIGFNPDYRLKDCHPIILGIGFTADRQVQVHGDAFRSTVDGEQSKDITAEIPGYSKAYSADGINYCAELAIPWVDYIFVNGVGRSGDGAPLYDLTDLTAAKDLDIGLWLAMVNDADGPAGWEGDTCMRTDNSNGQAWVAQGMSSICLTLADAPAGQKIVSLPFPVSGEDIAFSENFETTIDELTSRSNVNLELGSSCAVDIVDGKLKMEVNSTNEVIYLDFTTTFPKQFVFSYRYMVETAVPGEGSAACFILYPNEFVRVLNNSNTGSTYKYTDGVANANAEIELETKMGMWYTVYTAVDVDAGTYTMLRTADGDSEYTLITENMKLQDVPRTPYLRLMTERNSAAVAYYDDLEIRAYDQNHAAEIPVKVNEFYENPAGG